MSDYCRGCLPGLDCGNHASLRWVGLALLWHLECWLQTDYCKPGHWACPLEPLNCSKCMWGTAGRVSIVSPSQTSTSLNHYYKSCSWCVWKTFPLFRYSRLMVHSSRSSSSSSSRSNSSRHWRPVHWEPAIGNETETGQNRLKEMGLVCK